MSRAYLVNNEGLTAPFFWGVLAVAATGYLLLWARRWAVESRRLDDDIAALAQQVDDEQADARWVA